VLGAEARLVDALAADRLRDDHRALGSLREALALAGPQDLRRPFLGLDDQRVTALLRHLDRLGEGTPFGDTLLGLLDPGAGGRRSTSTLPEPLTDREMVVLSHMAHLQTNEEIADSLFVSVNTVKAHARAVYRKLAVSNRREAVNRARSLGLI
jgi:LuxR family maltose regulon positive regulatory protein